MIRIVLDKKKSWEVDVYVGDEKISTQTTLTRALQFADGVRAGLSYAGMTSEIIVQGSHT